MDGMRHCVSIAMDRSFLYMALSLRPLLIRMFYVSGNQTRVLASIPISKLETSSHSCLLDRNSKWPSSVDREMKHAFSIDRESC